MKHIIPSPSDFQKKNDTLQTKQKILGKKNNDKKLKTTFVQQNEKFSLEIHTNKEIKIIVNYTYSRIEPFLSAHARSTPKTII